MKKKIITILAALSVISAAAEKNVQRVPYKPEPLPVVQGGRVNFPPVEIHLTPGELTYSALAGETMPCDKTPQNLADIAAILEATAKALRDFNPKEMQVSTYYYEGEFVGLVVELPTTLKK